MKQTEPVVIYLSKHGCLPLWKGQAIVRRTSNGDHPVAYVKKAKNVNEKEYWDILNALFAPDV